MRQTITNSTSARTWNVVLGVAIFGLLTLVLRQGWQPLPVLFDSTYPSELSGSEIRLNRAAHANRPPATLTHYFRVTSEERRPDGVLKQIYLINDQFPGPLIEARSGDTMDITVENALLKRNQNISIHWHGLAMYGHNTMDGAAGLTQNAIEPGASFTYHFEIADNQAGTFWYHAHSAVQRADGLFGAFVIHTPFSRFAHDEPANDYLLMLGDWYHRTADDVLAWYRSADSFGMEPVPDSLLVNGRGLYNCEDAVPARPIDCQNTSEESVNLRFNAARPSRLRIINVGAYSSIDITIPGSSMQVMSVDGGNAARSDISDQFSGLQPGERVDVRVNSWHMEPKIQVSLQTGMFKYSNPALSPTHTFHTILESEKQHMLTTEQHEQSKVELAEVRPAYPASESIPDADVTLLLYTMTERLAHLDYVPTGNINRTIWEPQYPALVHLNREDWNEYQFVPRIEYWKDKPLWVDLVVNNLSEEDHPFHLHGYDFYVMSSYSSATSWGSWNPYEDATPPGGAFVDRPLRKDTVRIPRRGYAVLRFKANNPGLWMFHCHVMWHLAGGMAMAFEVS